MTELWAQEQAEAFWDFVGGAPEGWPRDLRSTVAFALPLAMVDIPRPRVESISRWLAQRGVSPIGPYHDRDLCACLVLRGGRGFVFLDETDPDDERRFSLAHEVVHYWLEYRVPRTEVERLIGPAGLEVLDGARHATSSERVRAVVAGIPLGESVHLMERDTAGLPQSRAVALAERRADALALELLAPADTVRAQLGVTATLSEAAALLTAGYALLPRIARQHARTLGVRMDDAPGLIHRLRVVSSFEDPTRNTR